VQEGERLPPGTDVVLVARPDIREIADQRGLSGVRDLLAELISRVDGAATSDGVSAGDRTGAAVQEAAT
jgi:hypothetical protein